MTDEKIIFPNVTDQNGLPVIFSYSYIGDDGIERQYVPVCPFCGGNHRHGHGEGDHGRRLSHCKDNKRQYNLVCLGEMPDLVRRHLDKCMNWINRRAEMRGER